MQSILQHSFFTLMDMFWLQATWNTFDLQKLKSTFHSVYKIPKKKLLGNNIHQIHMWADKNLVGINCQNIWIFRLEFWHSSWTYFVLFCFDLFSVGNCLWLLNE